MAKKKIEIGKLAPGMRLAENITNGAGMTLMPSGVRLTPMFISRLEKWSIASVYVLEEETQAEAPQPRTVAAAAVAMAARPDATQEQQEFARATALAVATWFSNLKEDPLMMQLRNIAIRKLVSDGPDGMLNKLRRGSGGGEDKT